MTDQKINSLNMLAYADRERLSSAIARGASRRDMLALLSALGIGAGFGGTLIGAATKAHTQTPKKGGKIRVAGFGSSTADTLDPAKQSYSTDYCRCTMFYNGLTELDATMNPKLALAESIDHEGYFHTGDAGVIDSDGDLRIIDRAKDVSKMADGKVFAPKYIENKLKFFSFIKEAVVFGAGRDSIGAFINIDFEAVGNWAERRDIGYSGYIDLAGNPAVAELITGCIEKMNQELSHESMLGHAQISRFLILHKELDPDDDELTRTRKVRRSFIEEKYKVLIDAIYGGLKEQFIETAVRFEDGRTGKVSATLRVHDTKTFPYGGAK